MPWVPFHFHFSTTGLSRFPSRGPSDFFQPKTPPHLPTRIHLKNCPGNLHVPSRAYIQLPPKQTSIVLDQPNSFSKFYPNTSPSTHPSYHPYQYPTITPSTCPTPTPSHTWDIPGHLGIPHGPHCTRIQAWIPLPGPVPDAVVYPGVQRG